MKNNKLSQNIITTIKSWRGFDKFDGKNPNYLSRDKEIPKWCEHPILFHAIEMDDCEVVKILIKAGADVNFIDPGTKDSPLLIIKEKSKHRAEITKELIAAGADANYVSVYELDSDNILDSPLMDACREGCLESVKLLIKAGADVNFQGNYGLTPLCSIDEESRHYDLISRILIEANADVNGCKGYPLQIAIRKSKLEAIKILVDAGSKLDIPSTDSTYNGRTAFMSFLKGEAMDLDESKEEELFLLFYKNMGNVNVQDNDGRSLIFYALDTYIGSDNFDLFVLDKILFTENIDINIQDNKGNTALNTLLLSLEQEGYSTDELYDYEKYKIKSLLIAGSDIEVKNNDGNSSKIIAKRMDNKEIQDLLENQKNLINTENRMGKTPLLIACLQGYTEKVEWLISKGSYVDTENKCHKIQRGIDLYDTFTPTYEDTIKPKFYTALMVAQNIEIVKALIKAGADINKKNADGNTALMVYAKNNWFEGVERLITAGANTNLVNNFYETALIIAKKNCKSKTTHYKEPEKLFYFLLERTTKKFIPSILSPLFSLFKNKQ